MPTVTERRSQQFRSRAQRQQQIRNGTTATVQRNVTTAQRNAETATEERHRKAGNQA